MNSTKCPKRAARAIYPIIVLAIASCERSNPLKTPDIVKPATATIVTTFPTQIHFDSAFAGGSISMNGDTNHVLESGICVDSLPDPDVNKGRIISTVDSGAFNCWISHLNSGSAYHVRAYMRQAGGITYGKDVSFDAFAYPPPVGNYFFNGQIFALCTDANNDIFAGGEFFATENVDTWFPVSVWNGNNWTNTPGNNSFQWIRALYTSPLGIVYSTNASDVQWNLVKYDANNWDQVGNIDGNNFWITTICGDAQGNIYVVTADNHLYSYGLGGFSTLRVFGQIPLTMAADKTGKLYVGGLMDNTATLDSFYIAVWDGAAWSTMGVFNDIITSICFDPSGNMIVAGAFNLDANGNIQSGAPVSNAGPQYYVAKWDGQKWSALGSLPLYKYYGNNIEHIYSDSKGNIYAIGDFTDANGQYDVLEWDGTTWSEIAAFNGHINALCIDAQDHVYAGGSFQRDPGQYYVAKCK